MKFVTTRRLSFLRIHLSFYHESYHYLKICNYREYVQNQPFLGALCFVGHLVIMILHNNDNLSGKMIRLILL